MHILHTFYNLFYMFLPGIPYRRRYPPVRRFVYFPHGFPPQEAVNTFYFILCFFRTAKIEISKSTRAPTAMQRKEMFIPCIMSRSP